MNLRTAEKWPWNVPFLILSFGQQGAPGQRWHRILGKVERRQCQQEEQFVVRISCKARRTR